MGFSHADRARRVKRDSRRPLSRQRDQRAAILCTEKEPSRIPNHAPSGPSRKIPLPTRVTHP